MSFSAIPFKIGNAIPKEIFLSCKTKKGNLSESFHAFRTDSMMMMRMSYRSENGEPGSRRWRHARKPCICSFGFIEKDCANAVRGFLRGLDTDQACWWYRHCSCFWAEKLQNWWWSSVLTNQLALFDRLPGRSYGDTVGDRTKWKTGFESIHLYYRHHMENKNHTERFYYILRNDTVHILHFTRIVYLEGC